LRYECLGGPPRIRPVAGLKSMQLDAFRSFLPLASWQFTVSVRLVYTSQDLYADCD
jgi:hypothetical protein